MVTVVCLSVYLSRRQPVLNVFICTRFLLPTVTGQPDKPYTYTEFSCVGKTSSQTHKLNACQLEKTWGENSVGVKLNQCSYLVCQVARHHKTPAAFGNIASFTSLRSMNDGHEQSNTSNYHLISYSQTPEKFFFSFRSDLLDCSLCIYNATK